MTSQRVYVAIDLETTGLRAQQDAIIEVGAVRFTCNPALSDDIEVLDRFVTFVNPGRTIPLRVQQLTGITNADVVTAPALASVAPHLLTFVGSDTRYTVAHNAGFDGGFLLAGGIDFHRPMQDTFELATILLPGAPSYSLGELARTYRIPLSDAHRALDDAEATARLFGLLLHRAAQLPAAVRRTLLRAGEGSGWEPLFLLADLETPGAAPTTRLADGSVAVAVEEDSDNGNLAEAPHMGAPSDHTLSCGEVEVDDLLPFFVSGGCLNDLLGPTYEYRAGQAQMAQRVMDALTKGDHLLIEAGTGTGKTLAYLLPASLHALEREQRTVIATNTIALQDQILDKEMPLVRRLLLRARGQAPEYALLKGRSNYLCTRRLHIWYRDRRLSRTELALLAKVLVWLQVTQTGDVAELFMHSPAERAMWQQINSNSATCTPERCIGHSHEGVDVLGPRYCDFFDRARRAAEAAHVLVVNHALLLTDIEAGGRILPAYDNVILDEAHRFEEAATDVLTYRADWSLLLRWLRDLQTSGDLARRVLAACVAEGDLACRGILAEIASLAVAAEGAALDFAESLRQFLSTHSDARAETGYTQRIAVDAALRSQPAWSEIEMAWEYAGSALVDLVDKLRTLSSLMADKQWWAAEPNASYLAAVTGTADEIHALAETVDDIVYATGDVQSGRLVSWAEIDDKMQEAGLVCAPMFVSDRLERELIHGKRSVILTGATLRTGSGFSFIRDRLGLWDVNASTVASPFDYKGSTLLFMPSDMPDPRNPHYQKAVERAIISSALAAQGSTVALFTSYAQLRTTADAIRGPLDQAGITVLEHGMGSRRRLLREYRETEKAVLLGTRTFWEGVDLPGDELMCLLIVRLPFAVPSDPLVAARTADLDNAFRDYTVPDAVLRFRQGFGRLIRRANDRGVVVLLDSRVWRKEYGQSFLESLPECTEKHAPLDTLHHEVSEWLNSKASER